MAQKTIVKLMRERHSRFIGNPTGTKGEQSDLARLSTAAVMNGMDSDDWREIMLLYAVNNNQLKRLRGREGVVLTDWQKKALAYIASEGVCSTDSVGGSGTGYFKDDSDDMVKFLESDGGDPTFNDEDPNWPESAEA